MYVLHEVAREARAECEVEPAVFLELVLIHETCEEHCREERAYDTYNPCRGKASDGACTEHVEYDTSDD